MSGNHSPLPPDYRAARETVLSPTKARWPWPSSNAPASKMAARSRLSIRANQSAPKYKPSNQDRIAT